MPNKHFCQGTNCHTYETSDRFLKSKGIIRGRYALSTIDSPSHWAQRAKYFCSTRCESDWLDTNMESIARRTLPPFIEHRRISEGYEKAKNHWGGNSIQKIGVDNDNDNDRIIP